ncbi:hypothetical protein DZC41_05045 [Acinetobacter haemolyticus]|nr:hypothetical protein AHTJS_08340 [Acinetobacter haemolyticus]ATZ67274.1 hypothetical protein BSR56_07830 [Acinetobacter haemolyticus]NCU22846.1 hypothetical protein [Acinetobacter haemolyticus]RSN77255.1 hypothetical protein EA769_04930 [Acinetobacter haemolyticus]
MVQSPAHEAKALFLTLSLTTQLLALRMRNIFRKSVAFLNPFTRNTVARLAHEEYIPQERCFS